MIAEPGTYRVADFVPYSREVLLRVHETYNEAIWPAQLLCLAAALGLAALLTSGGGRWSRRAVFWLLAAAWLVTGYGYYGVHLAPINPPATYYAWACAGQGVLLAVAPCMLRESDKTRKARSIFGGVFLLAALFPLGVLLGQEAAAWVLFGWGPGHTTAASLVLIAAWRGRLAKALLCIIPAGILMLTALTYYGLASR